MRLEQNIDTRSPFNHGRPLPTEIKELTKRRKLLAFTIILFVFLGILLSLRKITESGLQPVTPKEGDYLVYVVSPRSPNSQFMLYDPAENTHAPFLPDWNIRTLSISANGRLAFLSSHEGTPAIYALDYPFTNLVPIKITDYTSTLYYPIA
jgi:hypothetical protein